MNTHPPDQLGGTRHCLQEFKYAKNTLFVYFGSPSPPPKKTSQSKSANSQAKLRLMSADERHQVALDAVAQAPLESKCAGPE